MVSHRNLLYETIEGVARLTINRPEKLNALNRETLREMDEALQAFTGDPEARVLILTGSGDKAFVAGADIQELADHTPEQGREYSLYGQGVLRKLEAGPKPTIAAVNGFALGGGLELALACQVRLASEAAQMGLPEVTLGLIPGFGGTQRLPRLIGRGPALEMIMSGKRIDAGEALRLGLVNSVHPAGELLGAAEGLARAIMKRGPVAVAFAIEAVDRGLDLPLSEGLSLEAGLFGRLAETEDMREGTRAFLEKRKPSFKGR